ncbi:MAG: glycosyltransferase family 2 protein, partial [Bacteroidetes bacterium]
MSNISAVVITRNEERNIARCLEALRQVCTDIVVVDALSTDRTPDICRDCGVRLFQKEWENYSANKNFGNAQARHDWVLSIDADEVLSPELVATLQNLQPQTGCVYALDRLNNYCGVWVRHSGWYPNWKVRL